jgi:hypothetical protein
MKFDLRLPRAAVGRKELRDFLLAYRWVDRPITTKEIKESLKWKIWDVAPELVEKGMLEKNWPRQVSRDQAWRALGCAKFG